MSNRIPVMVGVEGSPYSRKLRALFENDGERYEMFHDQSLFEANVLNEDAKWRVYFAPSIRFLAYPCLSFFRTKANS